jgi:hypothetical protein
VVATRADFRQLNKEIAQGLQDLAAALALTPIHREFPEVAVEVPILAKSPDEVHRIAGLFGRKLTMEHHNGKLQTRFKAHFGDNRSVCLHVFAISND